MKYSLTWFKGEITDNDHLSGQTDNQNNHNGRRVYNITAKGSNQGVLIDHW